MQRRNASRKSEKIMLKLKMQEIPNSVKSGNRKISFLVSNSGEKVYAKLHRCVPKNFAIEKQYSIDLKDVKWLFIIEGKNSII